MLDSATLYRQAEVSSTFVRRPFSGPVMVAKRLLGLLFVLSVSVLTGCGHRNADGVPEMNDPEGDLENLQALGSESP